MIIKIIILNCFNLNWLLQVTKLYKGDNVLIDEFLTDGIKTGDFKYINYGNKCVVIEGVRSLIKSSEESVILKLKKGELEVKGNCLFIKELNKNSVCIMGEIASVETN